MKHLQKAPRKPLFNKEQGEVFVSMVDDDLHKEIANKIFVDGMTNEEVAEEIGYSKRQIERIRISLMKTILKVLLDKQIPKKPNIHGFREGREVNTVSYTCPICNKHIGRENFCKHCGQALDWSDTE
jgi:hypothetical protein